MKIEKLTDNKIRIIINIDELTDKNINFYNLSQNKNQARFFFKNYFK
ncbi:MAG: adaptor protein MecA [Clostridia bacterium]|nr:adaptor protein MecA [Clostridia bacterium]